MKQTLTLQSLQLTNFKGIKSLKVEPHGADIQIFGDNAAGKTTIADALFWVLFGKDSLGRKDFEIKTIDPVTGEVLHKLNHEVEALLSHNGKSLKLRNAYSENWVKTRGSSDSTFSGHTTDYFINDVPAQKKEYDAQISAICDEKQFRLLTDPNAFNITLSWQERRKMLLEICGDVTDEDVIASNPKLSKLPAILDGRSLDDHRKVLMATRPKINNEIEQIPVKIGELQRTVLGEVSQKIDTAPLQEAVNSLQSERATLLAGGQAAELTKQLREKEAEGQERINALKAEASKDYEETQIRLRKAREENAPVQLRIDTAKSKRESQERHKTTLESHKASLLETFHAESARTWTGETECSSCNQPLPAEKIEAAQSQFNLVKAKRIEENVAQGKATTAKIEEATAEIERLQIEESEAAEYQKEVAAKIAAIFKEAEGQTIGNIDASADDTYQSIMSRCEELRVEIEQLRHSSAGALGSVDERIRKATEELSQANVTNAQIESQGSVKVRIAELETEQKNLSAEYEKLNKELFLTEEFIRTKVSMLTDRINAQFSIANFKLFDVQVNGGIAECCETTVDGVPFSSLNHGMRLNAGLDIINTLAEHFGFAPPVVIDNAESVTKILPTLGQQIRLIVSADDKTLRFETAKARELATA